MKFCAQSTLCLITILIAAKGSGMGESLFTFFASLTYVPLFLLEQQNHLF